jgi:hypothetical protein
LTYAREVECDEEYSVLVPMAVLDFLPFKSLSAKQPLLVRPAKTRRCGTAQAKHRLAELLFAPFRDIDEGIRAAASRSVSADGSARQRGVRREPRLAAELPAAAPGGPR